MNTKIMYLYRDASNYKKYSEEVVAGELDSDQERQIKESLFEGEFFLPAQVGLPDSNRFYGTDDDHPWFELCECVPTTQEATAEVSAVQLVQNFVATRENWDILKYSDYLG